MEQARSNLAALTFGHVGEMLSGSLAVGWASMSRRASDTREHQSSTSWASLSGLLEVGTSFLGRLGEWDGLLQEVANMAVLNMTGRNDAVGTQSCRSGLGNLVAKHPPFSVYFASMSGSQRRSKDKNINE